jgi:NO-binding membrane sensor protein with MHYT domain
VCGMHYTGMYAVQMEHTKEALPATGIALSPTDMAYSVFAVTAVLLTVLLIYSTWKAQRTLRVDI